MSWIPLVTLIVLNILDLLSTRAFLALGQQEGNPLGVFLLNHFGFSGLVWAKIIISILFVIIGLCSPMFLKIVPVINLMLASTLILNILAIIRA